MFEIGGWSRGLLSLAAAAAPLLHRTDVLILREVDVQVACELATVEEVSQGGTLGSEDAGTETDAHVVVVHLVLLVTYNYLPLQERHQVHHDLSVQGRQLVQKIQHEGHLFLRFHHRLGKDVDQLYVQGIGHNRVL